jgi:hypothetical protein
VLEVAAEYKEVHVTLERVVGLAGKTILKLFLGSLILW